MDKSYQDTWLRTLSTKNSLELIQTVGPLLLLAAASVLWFWSLRDIDLQLMNDLGLVSVLPFGFFTSIILVSVSYAVSLHMNRSPIILVLHIVVLIFMLFGVAPVVEEGLRTAIAWKLVGIMDYIGRHGAVDPGLDAFHNWPGFFILVTFLGEALGLSNVMPLAEWAPLFFNLLYLGPLYLLFSSGTSNPSVRWLGIWFFYLANWIGQDYLAPQALGYCFYLLILAVLLRWFSASEAFRPLNLARLPERAASGAAQFQKWLVDGLRGPVPGTPRQRLFLMGVVIFLFAVLVPSHQLTPVAILAATTVLVLFRRITPRTLPILMIVLLGIWMSYMTIPYLSGHLDDLIEPLGALESNVAGNVTSRLRGSPGHVFVVRLRIALTLLLWGLALIGFIRRQRSGHRDVDFALLAVAPLGLVALANYGGELVLRVYYFSLPFVAFFVATLAFSTFRSSLRSLRPLFVAVLSTIFILGFFVGRYGNERMDYFTTAEIETIEVLYETAPPGSLLISATHFIPWRYRDYEVYRYQAVEREIIDGDYKELEEIMRSNEDSYLIFTRSQEASAALFWGWSEEQWEETLKRLVKSKDYRLVFENSDGVIFRYTGNQPLAKEEH